MLSVELFLLIIAVTSNSGTTIFQAITRVSPRLSPLLKGCLQNRANWQLEAQVQQGQQHHHLEKQAGEERAENEDKDKQESTTS